LRNPRGSSPSQCAGKDGRRVMEPARTSLAGRCVQINLSGFNWITGAVWPRSEQNPSGSTTPKPRSGKVQTIRVVGAHGRRTFVHTRWRLIRPHPAASGSSRPGTSDRYPRAPSRMASSVPRNPPAGASDSCLSLPIPHVELARRANTNIAGIWRPRSTSAEADTDPNLHSSSDGSDIR